MHNNNHADSLGYQTGLAARLFNNLLTRRLKDAGIEMTAEQWGVVQVLLTHGAMSHGQLGEMLYLEKSTVSRSVNGLEKRGWVICEKSVEDGRFRLVILTPNAIDVAQHCSAIAKSVLEDAQRGLNPESISASLEQLSEVIKNLRKQS